MARRPVPFLLDDAGTGAAGAAGWDSSERGEPPPIDDADAALERTLGSFAYQRRAIVGVGCALFGANSAFQFLPQLTDAKLVQEARLPGLTEDAVTAADTAFMVGWFVSSAALGKLMDRFGRKSYMRAGSWALLVVTLAMVTLPYLTAGNAAVFCCIKACLGALMSVSVVAATYTQEAVPPRLRNRAMVWIHWFYSAFLFLMCLVCGTLTLASDWRLEVALWYMVPALLALSCGLPSVGESLGYLVDKHRHEEARQLLDRIAACNAVPDGLAREVCPVKPATCNLPNVNAVASNPSRGSENVRIAKLATCFVACGLGLYGLNFSVGELTEHVFLNVACFALADLVGWTGAIGIDVIGRRSAQRLSFCGAGVCLLCCGLLTPNTWPMIVCATIGRMFLDVCFNAVYVAVVDEFSGSSRARALTMCQLAARGGGIFAPVCGRLPAPVSCSIFGALCAVAAVLT